MVRLVAERRNFTMKPFDPSKRAIDDVGATWMHTAYVLRNPGSLRSARRPERHSLLDTGPRAGADVEEHERH